MPRVVLACTSESERNFAKAVDTYQALAADLRPDDFLFEQALLDLGRAQALAGRTPEAIATYQRLLKELPSARRADDVRARLSALGAPADPASR